MLGGYSLVRNRTFTRVLGPYSGVCVKSRISRTAFLPPIVLYLFGAHQQHRDIDGVTHLVGSRPVQNVADEAVPVCSHSDQIDIFLAGELDDFIGWLAQREHRVARKTFVS